MMENARYAVIDIAAGMVINVVMWDGDATQWSPEEGLIAVVIPDGSDAGIGWTFEDGIFVAPYVAPPAPPSPAEILATNTAIRNARLDQASRAMAPLQDAVDLDEATPQETALLKAWKQYRVALNRIDLSLASPAWPVPPQNGYDSTAPEEQTS